MDEVITLVARFNNVLNVNMIVGAFNYEDKALVWVFFVIVKLECSFPALEGNPRWLGDIFQFLIIHVLETI